jgi:uncharacterized membrane protein
MALQQIIELIGQVIDAAGVVVIAAGIVVAVALAIRDGRRRAADVYGATRRRFGRAILLGLELLVAADIIRTVAIEPTLESLAVLGVIVLIRTFLSFTLEVELEGRWPWQQSQPASEPHPDPDGPRPAG